MNIANKSSRQVVMIGSVFLSLSVICFFLLSSLFLRLDKDFSYEADVISYDSFYNTTTNSYDDEIQSNSRFYFITEKEEDGVLHLDHGFSVRGHKNSIIFEVERQYAIDRITKQHVSAYGDESRNGFLFSSRSALANKKSFTYWHVNYDVPIEMSFTKKELINDLEVYVYEGTLLADQTQNLTNLSGVPEAYGIQTEADLKLYIEPNTGYLVNYEDTAVAWYVDQETGEKNMPWNSFSNTYSDLSLSFHVGEAQQQKSIYHFIKYIAGGILLLIALIFFIVAYIRYHREDDFIVREVKYKSVFTVPTIVFIILILFNIWILIQVRNSIKQDNFDLFNQETKLILRALETRTDIYAGALQSGVALFNSSSKVNRNEWKSFAESLNIKDKFPGIQGYGYSVFIPKDELNSHINNIQREGFYDYSVFPEEKKDEYTSIIFLEPFDERNQQAFGLDMTFETNRRTAMHKARDTGGPQLSGRVILVQEIGDDVQPGFLMYVPHYKKEASLKTVEERKNALLGYVYAPFRMRDFMGGILGERDLVLDFSIYDGVEVNQDQLMYSSLRTGDVPEVDPEFEYLTKQEVVNIEGRDWTIVYSARPEISLLLTSTSNASLVLWAGLILSLLISIVVYLLSASRFRALGIAKSMTSELKNTLKKVKKAQIKAEIEEEKSKAILSNVGDALIVVDQKGKIILVNKRFEFVTGWSQEEVVGKDVIDQFDIYNEDGSVMDESERPVNIALSERKQVVREFQEVGIQYKTKKGDLFPISVSASPIVFEGELIGAVEVFRDVTREKQVDTAKTEFVSLASHQLRTPLTAIRWYTEILLTDKDKILTEDYVEYLNEIDYGSNRMIRLVNSLLNVSRIELGTFAVDAKPLNLKTLVREVIKDISILRDKKDLKLIIEDDNAPEAYKADDNLIRIVFQNLISNSFKYTEKGSVSVKVYPKNKKTLRIEVQDTGYGIPNNQKDQIFNKLFRADNVREQDTTGTGLGLYITKAIIEESQGKIWFESGKGKGTTFFVELPLSGMKQKEGSKLLGL